MFLELKRLINNNMNTLHEISSSVDVDEIGNFNMTRKIAKTYCFLILLSIRDGIINKKFDQFHG